MKGDVTKNVLAVLIMIVVVSIFTLYSDKVIPVSWLTIVGLILPAVIGIVGYLVLSGRFPLKLTLINVVPIGAMAATFVVINGLSPSEADTLPLTFIYVLIFMLISTVCAIGAEIVLSLSSKGQKKRVDKVSE